MDHKKEKEHYFTGIIALLFVCMLFSSIAFVIKKNKDILETGQILEQKVDTVIHNQYEIFDQIEIVKIDRNGITHFHDKDDNHIYMIQKKVKIEIFTDDYKGK